MWHLKQRTKRTKQSTKWLYSTNEEEKRRTYRLILSENAQIAAFLVMWTENGPEGDLAGGWDDQGKLHGGRRS